ncbi:MAG: PIG-L family deacetylase, partial [Planctomycetes bacterium]|nr:PIG-L family deacetylase [Planctomycetota bacterium]
PTPHGTPEIRARETAAANKVLGITERLCLGFPNRVLMDTEEARRRLATEIRRVRPEIIFTHVERDAHPDHLAAVAITRGAVLLSRIVKIDLEYEPFRPGRVFRFLCSHLRYAYQPSFILEVKEEDYQAKCQALLCYESQFVHNQSNIEVIDRLETRMKYFGSLGRVKYGEAFIADEPVCLSDVTAIVSSTTGTDKQA